uniref:(northern house mosquito) hypothetical protein n=1 Tax=Culex pipiens TaxID=7175 RepID=A0A8D8E4T7_CULPI
MPVRWSSGTEKPTTRTPPPSSESFIPAIASRSSRTTCTVRQSTRTTSTKPTSSSSVLATVTSSEKLTPCSPPARNVRCTKCPDPTPSAPTTLCAISSKSSSTACSGRVVTTRARSVWTTSRRHFRRTRRAASGSG